MVPHILFDAWIHPLANLRQALVSQKVASSIRPVGILIADLTANITALSSHRIPFQEDAMRLVECVPNFSEGRNEKVINSIADSIKAVSGVKLLDVDPGYSTNRTVVTFVGEPEAVVEAAFQAIATASKLIDMRKHSGEHPRMGAN